MGVTDDVHSLAYTKWKSKEPNVFVPKYKRKVI